MQKINKPIVKATTPDQGVRKEIERVRVSNKSNQNLNFTGGGYSMFDGPQAENEHMSRHHIKSASENETKSEEFHWMASAAYNQ
jgi:hypothetical protein